MSKHAHHAKDEDDAGEKVEGKRKHEPAAPPKFAEGAKVKHCVTDCGCPAGPGTIEKCCPCDKGGECEYEVRDEATGRTVKCKESTLSAL